MARIGDRGVFIGSPDWYIGDDRAYAPSTELTPTAAQLAMNDTVQLDGSGTYDNDPLGDRLFYEWDIIESPPRSARRLRVAPDGQTAKLVLDDVGPFFVEMRVFAANGGQGATQRAALIAQPAAAPYDPQQVYSTSWLWQYLPDVWQTLPLADRLKIETFWRGLQQLVASDVMQVMNTRDALSIATIQDRVFRKWVRVDMRLPAQDLRVLPRIAHSYDIAESSGDVFAQKLTLSGSADLTALPAVSGGGALINARTVVLDSYNLQPRDVGKEVVLSGLASGERRARIAALVAVGDRVGGTLSVPLNVDPPDYPIGVAVTLASLPKELGAIVTDVGTVEVGITQTPGVFSVAGFVASPTRATAYAQIKLPGAFAAGVRVGDIVECEITDIVGQSAVHYADVAGVSRDFVCVVPRGSIEDALASLTAHAAEHAAEAETLAWQRRHIDAWLSADDFIEFGVNTSRHERFRIRTRAVLRRSATTVHETTRALFRLTERTERALIDGASLITEGLEELPLQRPLVDLYENLDFQVRHPSDSGSALVSDGSTTVFSPRYDFVRAQVYPGDTLTITSGAGAGTYRIVSATARTLRLDRAVPAQGAATFNVRGASPNALVVFNSPIPEGVTALWAETAVSSNSEAIDAQFGKLVGLRLDEWVTRGLTNTYRDAVLGLMYARMTASALGQIENAVSLVAGIPFAPHRSRIAEIDTEYYTAPYGRGTTRVVLEEILPDGTATQRYSAHTFPSASEALNAASVGIGTNIEEGRPYVVGDIIEQFTALALGVKVYDIYTAPTTYTLDDVLHRHRFRAVIDVDAARLTSQTTQFIYDFVVEIKPAYTHFLLMLSKFLLDTISIEEDVHFRMRAGFYDNPYHHRGPANIVDDLNPERDRVDQAAVSTLTTWFPRDGAVTFTNSGATLVSAVGGFVDPSSQLGAGAEWPQPWLRAGDIVELRGRKLRLMVETIDSDTQLTLSGIIPVELQFAHITDAPFVVMRSRTDVIFARLADLGSSDTLPLSLVGTTASDVGVGDVLTLSVATAPLRVVHIDRTADSAKIYTYPRRPLIATEDVVLSAFREHIVDRVLYDGALTLRRRVNNQDVIYTLPRALTYGIEPGDDVRISGQVTRRVVCVTQDTLSLAPPLPRGADMSAVQIVRPGRNIGGDDMDEHERAVGSSVELVMKNVPVRMCGAIVRAPIALRAGDILYFPDQVFDHGEGRGIVRVMAVLGGCVYVTSRARLNTVHVTIIRQSPLRWMYYTSPDEQGVYGDWATQHWR